MHQKVTEQHMGDRIYDMARKAVIMSAKDALSLFLNYICSKYYPLSLPCQLKVSHIKRD